MVYLEKYFDSFEANYRYLTFFICFKCLFIFLCSVGKIIQKCNMAFLAQKSSYVKISLQKIYKNQLLYI